MSEQSNKIPIDNQLEERIIAAIRAKKFKISENPLRVILTYLEPKLPETGIQRSNDEIIKEIVDIFKGDGDVLEKKPNKVKYRIIDGKTVKKTYSLSEELADAIALVAKSRGVSASRLIEDTMRDIPSLHEELRKD